LWNQSKGRAVNSSNLDRILHRFRYDCIAECKIADFKHGTVIKPFGASSFLRIYAQSVGLSSSTRYTKNSGLIARCGRSRLFKIIETGTNRQSVCDSAVTWAITYRFRDIANLRREVVQKSSFLLTLASHRPMSIARTDP